MGIVMGFAAGIKKRLLSCNRRCESDTRVSAQSAGQMHENPRGFTVGHIDLSHITTKGRPAAGIRPETTRHFSIYSFHTCAVIACGSISGGQIGQPRKLDADIGAGGTVWY
jgi:hypothetical protein